MSTAIPYLEDQTDRITAPGIGDERLPEPKPEQTEATEAVAAAGEVQCLCPFCGSLNGGVGRVCARCQQAENSEAREAARQQSGSWFVLQADNTNAPGINFEQLRTLVQQGFVTPRSVVRGPGTGHLWRLASKVRGISRELGVCYSCGGNIETTEINCPHCDRAQSIAEASAPLAPVVAAAKTEIPLPPVTEPKAAEPAIHVRTLSSSAPGNELQRIPRPVIAEQSERHIPKDDLLTPRDLAKAFQLEFGVQADRAQLLFDQPRGRQLKIFLSGAGALVIATALVWPLVHVVSGRINSSVPMANAVPLQVASADPVKSLAADARTASDQIAINHPDSASIPASVNAPEFRPAPSADPIIVADPSSDHSSADDPSVLWNSGLDAESAGDYAKAVDAYERIESLPSYSWPSHLQVRLELARKELKGEMH